MEGEGRNDSRVVLVNISSLSAQHLQCHDKNCLCLLDDIMMMVRMEVSLADASWLSVLHLSTATVSYQGDRSTGLDIFAGVRLAPPDNIRIR